jgi:hypothetical protein
VRAASGKLTALFNREAPALAAQIADICQERARFLRQLILLPMINEAFFVLAEGDASGTEIARAYRSVAITRWARWRWAT